MEENTTNSVPTSKVEVEIKNTVEREREEKSHKKSTQASNTEAAGSEEDAQIRKIANDVFKKLGEYMNAEVAGRLCFSIVIIGKECS